MRNIFRTILFATLFFSAAFANALTGNEYRNLNSRDRLTWTVGVADGILTNYVIEVKKTSPFAECLGKLEREQIRAIFEKELESNPESWHFPAAFTFYSTFKKFCGVK